MIEDRIPVDRSHSVDQLRREERIAPDVGAEAGAEHDVVGDTRLTGTESQRDGAAVQGGRDDVDAGIDLNVGQARNEPATPGGTNRATVEPAPGRAGNPGEGIREGQQP